MSTADLGVAVTAYGLARPTAWRGRAFGLELYSDAILPSVTLSTGAALSRRTTVEINRPRARKDVWRSDESRTLVSRSYVRGRPMLRVEYNARSGYRIWGPGHGRHFVSADGSSVSSFVAGEQDRRWERLFFAQALPLAALLQGLELFHASAVALRGRAVAFVAPSGTGKTSLAAHLVAGGAALVTDDVLALECSEGRVVAYPGANVLHLSESELATMTAEGRARVGAVARTSDKAQLAIVAVPEALELGAVYFVTRGTHGALEVEELSPPAPQRLLASAFLSYLDRPARLIGQLDFCVEFARCVRAFEVRVPAAFGASRLAAEIEAHVEREL